MRGGDRHNGYAERLEKRFPRQAQHEAAVVGGKPAAVRD